VAGAQGDVLGDRHPLDEAQVLVDEGHVAKGGSGGRPSRRSSEARKLAEAREAARVRRGG
ncbi:hypothetical protein ACFWIJ_09085, partial [Streptomyces sp. NPDC127079]|uniref:hypothetical protein n=1 Tax=Streptomyces sp. NPDC127079 TaxID=3347132 RepID=UPI0036668B8B